MTAIIHSNRQMISYWVVLVLCGLWNPVSSASGVVNALEGMSVYGNRELPKALVIVPWKPSLQAVGTLQAGRPSMTDVLVPLDREVFLRRLTIHETVNRQP